MDLLTDIPINILIVDDEPKNLTVLETVLNDPGYRLIRAESADQALLALVVDEFALLILDIRMPVMTGIELAAMIRERKKTARVPIIFLTAYYSEDKHVLAGYDTGAVDYLYKPVNAQILRSKVAVFVELHRKGRALEMANRALLSEVTVRRRAEEQLRELNDTLEQRVLERTEALRESDRRKDDFLAILAHELRNPLAPLRNALQVLKMTGTREVFDQFREMMERQLQQMVRLVDDLLDVSRITRGKIGLLKQRVGLATVVQSAVETSRPAIDASGHELSISLPSQPIYIDADATRLAQVFSNLMNNSAKFTPAGGNIWLKAERHGNEVVVTVKDNGIGIPDQMLPNIFDMFTQVDRTLERSRGGLGVGLTLAKRLVELHDGSVEARSEGPGRGSEFIVHLPVVLEQMSLQTQPAAKIESIASPVRRRILVVDDNEDSASSLGMMLELMGHEVHIAHDGLAAVEAAGKVHPGIILLDIGMPKLNGYDAARRIRQLPGGKDIFLIALTGWGQAQDKLRSQEAGFDHHMVKPVESAALEKLLASWPPI